MGLDVLHDVVLFAHVAKVDEVLWFGSIDA